jgi:hypothetical protein
VVPAPAVTQASWNPDALEELLAPIALYPDQLLGQILAASINSQEVMDGGNWLLQNQDLKGNELDAAAQKAGFGPAMRALLQYPTVVDMMCQEIDWTRQVGSAFNSDQKSVLDAVQRLRMQAADVGNLKSTPQQAVETRTENGTEVVEVKPADPKVVYVPQYDPQAVYTTPPAAPATTSTPTSTTETESKTESKEDGVSTGAAVAAGLIGFGLGVVVGDALHDDDYYYPHWGYGAVYYGPRPFYPPAYVYRPVYGPAFRPAYRYTSPPGYRYGYNNVRGNNNVVINNKNYYNRFNNNQNLRGPTQSPLVASRENAGRPRAGQTARPAETANWRGQSTYAGARKTETDTRLREPARDSRPGSSTASVPARDGQPPGRQVDRGDVDSARTARREGNTSERARPSPPTAGQSGQQATPHVDRGYGDSTRTARPEVNTSERAQPSRPATGQSAARRDSAFSSAQAQGGGDFQRAASARGDASVGTRQASARARRR